MFGWSADGLPQTLKGYTMKIRIILEVEADTPKDHQADLTPQQLWLLNRDMLWMVHGQGDGGSEECITLVDESPVA